MRSLLIVALLVATAVWVILTAWAMITSTPATTAMNLLTVAAAVLWVAVFATRPSRAR